MTVVLNEAALFELLDTPVGAVGLDLRRRAEQVAALARQNSAGPIIGIQSGDLNSGINVQIVEHPILEARISTPAEHRNFFYPAFWDRNGRPWLTEALRDGYH
jgi:hypothetical protein